MRIWFEFSDRDSFEQFGAKLQIPGMSDYLHSFVTLKKQFAHAHNLR